MKCYEADVWFRNFSVSTKLLQRCMLVTLEHTEALCMRHDKGTGQLIRNILDRFLNMHTTCFKWRFSFRPSEMTSAVVVMPEGCGHCFWVALTL